MPSLGSGFHLKQCIFICVVTYINHFFILLSTSHNSLFIHLATEEHDASGSDEFIINSIMNKAAIDRHVLLSISRVLI